MSFSIPGFHNKSKGENEISVLGVMTSFFEWQDRYFNLPSSDTSILENIAIQRLMGGREERQGELKKGKENLNKGKYKYKKPKKRKD